MSFFNKLEEAGCISSSGRTSISLVNEDRNMESCGWEGHIRGRLEEDWEGVPLAGIRDFFKRARARHVKSRVLDLIYVSPLPRVSLDASCAP